MIYTMALDHKAISDRNEIRMRQQVTDLANTDEQKRLITIAFAIESSERRDEEFGDDPQAIFDDIMSRFYGRFNSYEELTEAWNPELYKKLKAIDFFEVIEYFDFKQYANNVIGDEHNIIQDVSTLDNIIYVFKST